MTTARALAAEAGYKLLAGLGALGLVVALVLPALIGEWSAAGIVNVLLLPLPVLGAGLFAYAKRPDHPTARRLLLAGALFSVSTGCEYLIAAADKADGAHTWFWLPLVVSQLATVGSVVAVAAVFGLFPDGRYERRYELLLRGAWALLLAPPVLLVSRPELLLPNYLFDDPTPQIPSPFAIDSPAGIAPAAEAAYGIAPLVLVAGVVLLVLRYRRAERERQLQMKWLALAGLVPAAVELLQALLRASELASASTLDSLYIAFTAPAILAFLAAILVALLRHRLFDIDVVIRRSLLYGGLSLAIGAAYLGIAAALGIAAGSRFPIGVAVLITIAVTLGFQPLRRRVDRLAGRWILGERLSGYELLSRFGETIEHAFDLGELAPEIAGSVRDGLRLRWVRVQLGVGTEAGGRLEPAAAAGIELDAGAAPALAMPLVHAGERVGSIECGPKVEGRIDEADRELLATLARQAALAVHNARLAAELAARLDEISRQAGELAASRARIVHAQDTERRRIERNIHDGVQQEIVSLAAKLRLARNQLRRDPGSADATLAALQEETRQTLDDLRELARGIHPTVLSDRGLLEAIESRVARLPSSVTIKSDRGMRARRFPEEIEAAAYFVVSEGLTNALKHAAPTSVQVALSSRDGSLLVEVEDDGGGFEPGVADGSGLIGLGDRVEALEGTLGIESSPGHGTRLVAEFPARVEETADG